MKRFVLAVSLAFGTILALAATGVAGATTNNPTSAGYIAQFAAQTVTFDGSVNVPAAKCLNAQGDDGYLVTTFGLVGTNGDVFGQITTTCPAGVPTYTATVSDLAGGSASEPVSAGDTVTFATTVSPTSESYTLTDSSSGPISLTGPGFAVTQAQVLQEAQVGPFPKFALLKFGPITFNGASWAQLDPTGYNQANNGTTVQLKVGKLHKDGAFHVKYVSQG
jgi:hypothetical protein